MAATPSQVDTQEPAQTAAAANLGWNFGVNLLDVAFITLGLSLISRDTVLPILVTQLTDSTLAVGMIAAIWGFGMYLPQLFTANFAEGLRYKKPFLMVLSSFGERLPYLLMAFVVFFLAVPLPTLALALLFVLLAIAALSAGAGTPAWYDMIAKVIPVERRGLWAGLGTGLGALMGIVGAWFVGRILDAYVFPNNFALLFVLAFVFVMVSWVGLALNREPPSLDVKQPQPLRRYFRQLPAILRSNHNYRRFFVARTVVQFGAMASSFIIVYGSERFGLSGAQVGLLTGVLIGAQAVMGLVWGPLGDRLGHKLVLTGAAAAICLASAAALVAPAWEWLIASFALLGAYAAADWVSGLNIILEFCDPADRPTYIGLTNTLLAPSIIVAPLIGGWLAMTVGYGGLLTTAGLIAGCGAALFAFWVSEPRHLAAAEANAGAEPSA